MSWILNCVHPKLQAKQIKFKINPKNPKSTLLNSFCVLH